MKNIVLILLCFTFYSCEKENSEKRYSATGTYKLVGAGIHELVYSGDDGDNVDSKYTNLFTDCTRNSLITINSNGTFEITDFSENGGICESRSMSGTWSYKELLYNNNLGEFRVNNSDIVYEIYSKGVNSFYQVTKIDVAYGSVLDDPSGRYIFTYDRTF